MNTLFNLSPKQTDRVAIIGVAVIIAIVAFALCVGDVSNLSNTFLG